ncbi:hypothetical protein KIN20_031666 [Parelaphostrongylus tenuis]|uniref:ABC transmembrane type-1 domain-containing protein n=1 Tax=Parelaphostrongylus tenuis TaxID=148309 RepID=A0AAD5R5P4_PARTN|nr:hypothetical protein KIN20_031666 [Parelaphostrongylus tenuis]
MIICSESIATSGVLRHPDSMNGKLKSNYSGTSPENSAKKQTKATAGEDSSSDKVSLPVLFRYATRLDFCLLLLGAVLAVMQGTLSSLSTLIFKHLLDALIIGQFEWEMGIFDDYEFTQLAMNAVYNYTAFGLSQFILGFLSMCCWHTVCERQVFQIRNRYFGAVLRQDMAWFDRNETGALTSRMMGSTVLGMV